MANKPSSASGQAPAAAETEPKRTRAAISPAKALAIQVAGLVSILRSKPVAAVLTEPQKAQVVAAENASRELNAKTIQPIKDRISAIQKEFQELMPKVLEPGVADKAKALSIELGRKQKQLQQLTQTASA